MTNDLISRSALLAEIDNERRRHVDSGNYGAEHLMVHSLRRLVEDATSVDAVPVAHGRWTFPWTSPECSVCKKTQKWTSKYCPNCGAKMDGDS